jgi:hypothetical protein
MGSVKPEPVFVPQHERAKAWKMRALEITVRRMRARLEADAVRRWGADA